MSRPAIVILYCLLAVHAAVRGADILKSDGSVVSGDVQSFDGRDLRLQLSSQSSTKPAATLSIDEIVQIRFHDISEWSNVDSNPAPAQSGKLPPVWRLKLSDGQVITGALRAWSENQFKIEQQQSRLVLEVPVSAIREIWRTSPEFVQKAIAMKLTANAEDLAYVLKDDDIVAVKGSVLGLEGTSLGFVYEGQQRKIGVDRIVGVVLTPQKRSAATRPVAAGELNAINVSMVNGDVLSGSWKLFKDRTASIQSPWDQTLQLPQASISTIEIRNGRTTYLSELKPVKVEQTPYFDRVIPWRADSALDGGPLKLNDGKQYAHGIAMHSRCLLVYDLAGGFDEYHTRLGFEPIPSGAPEGRVAVRVLLDGKILFEAADFHSGESPRNLALNVHAGKLLTLEVDFGADEDVNDRVVWADARLVRHNPADQ
jgi:hypothetical protein